MDVTLAGSVSPATVAPALGVPGAGHTEGAPPTNALADQRRRITARDVLTAMPPMVAEQIQRSTPGGPAPLGAVDALLKAMQGGEFHPSTEQLAATDCLIATTARAVQTFDSAEQLWETIRQMLGSVPPPQEATNYVGATEVAAAVGERAAAPAPAAVASHAQAEAILGGPLTALQMNWWETAIRFLVEEARTTSLRTTTPAPIPVAAPAVTNP